MTQSYTSNDNTPAVAVENTDGGVGISAVSRFVAVKADITGGINAIWAKTNGGGTAIYADASPDTDGNCRAGFFISAAKTLPTVECTGLDNMGLKAYSNSNIGIYGASALSAGVNGNSVESDGVRGESLRGMGVHGTNDFPQGGSIKPNYGCGVWGESTNGYGVFASSDNNVGVSGNSVNNIGVYGQSQVNNAVQGNSKSPDHSGVAGFNDGGGTGVAGVNTGGGIGVYGQSQGNNAVQGNSKSARDSGVAGFNDGGGIGVFGQSTGNDGVQGNSLDVNHSGVAGFNHAGGIGVFGTSVGGLAGKFQGDVEVTGDIRLTNADCAEDFNIGSDVKIEPGTVMVLGEEGTLFPSQRGYDKCVVGVVSGAGNYKPGIVLDKQESENNRQPIALLGKVYCKVDAQYGVVEVGDLLTTSPTPGYAMKADDPIKAFGAVIGKALRPLNEGQGLIPILVALQ